jgi:hypothetical protein
LRAIATGLPPPWALVYRSLETTKIGPRTGFRIQLTSEEAFQKAWRGWMGIEPTQDASQRPANGFEDRGSGVHQRPYKAAQIRFGNADSENVRRRSQ